MCTEILFVLTFSTLNSDLEGKMDLTLKTKGISHNLECSGMNCLLTTKKKKKKKKKLCPLVYQRIADLGILVRPKTKRGTLAGRPHRLWHSLPPGSVLHAAPRPPLPIDSPEKDSRCSAVFDHRWSTERSLFPSSHIDRQRSLGRLLPYPSVIDHQ